MIPTIHSEWWANLALDVGVLLLALLLDRFSPEPPARVHPVVWMGRLINGLERWAPRRPAAALAYGAVGVALTIGAWGALTWLAILGLTELGTVAYLLGGAILLRTCFTARGLIAAGESTRAALEREDLDDARASLQSLVSRDRAELSGRLPSQPTWPPTLIAAVSCCGKRSRNDCKSMSRRPPAWRRWMTGHTFRTLAM